MTPTDFNFFYSILSAFGLGGFVVFVVFWSMRSYFFSYFSEKAKNLATKEDIAAITTAVEHAKKPYVEGIENLKSHHQLRLAAIDARLKAHQEAFTLWREMLRTIYTGNVHELVLKCETWWDQNCVYLEPEVRQGFVEAYTAAADHKEMLQARADVEVIKENWRRITRFPDTLFDAVQLPRLTKTETEALGKSSAGFVSPYGLPKAPG